MNAHCGGTATDMHVVYDSIETGVDRGGIETDENCCGTGTGIQL